MQCFLCLPALLQLAPLLAHQALLPFLPHNVAAHNWSVRRAL